IPLASRRSPWPPSAATRTWSAACPTTPGPLACWDTRRRSPSRRDCRPPSRGSARPWRARACCEGGGARSPAHVIHVVVPAYNEAGNVAALLAQIRERVEPFAQRWRIVVVDDGSTDGTAEECARAAAGAPIEVVRHERNLGPGAAFRTGFLHVLQSAQPLDVVVTVEGDQTSDASILPRLLHRVWEEGDHIALASCYLYGGGIVGTHLHRVGLSHVANGLMKKALGLSGLATLSSFYRVYTAGALMALRDRYGEQFITPRGFECMVEVLYRASRLGLRISEVPVVLDGRRRVGKSKMKVLRTSMAYLVLAARALSGRL